MLYLRVIYVDKGEYNRNRVYLASLKKRGYKIIPQHLEVGDVVFGEVGIEIKIHNDLIASCKDGRLWDQASNLKNSFKYPFICVIGHVFGGDNLPLEVYQYRNQLFGIDISLQLSYGISVKIFPDEYSLAEYISRLFLKIGDAGKGIKPVFRLKPRDDYESVWFNILTSVPHIGSITAKKILEIPNFRDILGDGELLSKSIKLRDIQRKSLVKIFGRGGE